MDTPRKLTDHEQKWMEAPVGYIGPYLSGVGVTQAAAARLKWLEDTYDMLRDLEKSTSPCGHLSVFAVFDDGIGKHIRCLMCQEQRLREAERLLKDLRIPMWAARWRQECADVDAFLGSQS